MSSRAIFIFMAPISTSKWLSSIRRDMTAGRPTDFSLTVSPSETCFHHLRLGMGITLVGAGGVGHHGRIKLLAKFAAQLGDASFGVFGQLLRDGPILNRR